MSALEYANRFDSLAKPNKANGSSRHLLDANCDYVDGAFRLSCLPPKLPFLFTVRFTAPADFTPGDVFTLKGQEYTVRTRGMEEPTGKLFGAGAVVLNSTSRGFVRLPLAGGPKNGGHYISP